MVTNTPDDGTELRFADDDARVAERRANSTEPFLGGYGWSFRVVPGGTVLGRVSIEFPRPEAIPPESHLYVHVWIGAESGVDPRFPRLTEPDVSGVQPGYTQVPEFPIARDRALLDFRLKVPVDVEPTVYLGNVALLRRDPFTAGEVLDRTTFAFRVAAAPAAD
ncbi:hypothetical protein [Mycolicibacterium sp.]|uniref:hypothetical protein n=1 Tax=Mycolicibacterium sp. TaxID=2320850 RepID=UPI003D0A7A83